MVYIGVEGLREDGYYTGVVMDEEKEKAHKTWYNTFYNTLFGGQYPKF